MDIQKALKQAETVLEAFDFNLVHSYMRINGWKYGREVPSLENIKSTARGVLVQAITGKGPDGHRGVYCGGFEARIDQWDNGKYNMELSFIIESSGTYFD